MKYSLEITMTYVGLGANPDGSVVRTVDADLSNVKFSVENDNSRPVRTISGNVIVSKDDYDYFGLYLNDTSGYYVDSDYFTYTLIQNGTTLDVNKIQLTNNNIENNILTFKLYDEIIDGYRSIYEDWSNTYNVVQNVADDGQHHYYTDFRSIRTKQTTPANVYIPDFQAYIDQINSSDDLWQPTEFGFTYVSLDHYNVRIEWSQFWAYGYYSPDKEPPPGVRWVYDADVGADPRYYKKPKFVSQDAPYYSAPEIIVAITTEAISDIDYEGRCKLLDTVIIYLIGEADNTIVFDANSFTDFHDVDGETFGSYTYATKPFNTLRLAILSDIIPDGDGTIRYYAAETGMLSFKTIDEFIRSIGAYWYLENIAGTYYFRLSHITKKTLASGNSDLTNYFGKNYLFKTRNLNVIESGFDKIDNNSQSSGYDFRLPNYKYRNDKKIISFTSLNMITDIDYVIDAKTEVFDDTVDDQWVFFADTVVQEAGLFPNRVRNITSGLTGLSTNNYEMSFYWLSLNLMEMPGKVSVDTTVFADSRVSKLQSIELDIPIDHIFTDFDFFGYISYYGIEAEIESITQNALNNIAKLRIKFLHL